MQDGVWRVAGRGVGGLAEPADVLDMGNSGTAARLLTGMLASHDLFAVLTGDASLRGRPMRRVTEPLALCGARFSAREGGRLPLAVQGAARRDADPLPLAGRLGAGEIRHPAGRAERAWPDRGGGAGRRPATTPRTMLRHFGAEVSVEQAGDGRVIALIGQPELRARDVVGARGPVLRRLPGRGGAAGAGVAVTVPGVGLNPLRAGLFATLREMGADLAVGNERVEAGEPVGDIDCADGALARHRRAAGPRAVDDRRVPGAGRRCGVRRRAPRACAVWRSCG